MTLILTDFQTTALQAEASNRGITPTELVMQHIEAIERNHMAQLRVLMTPVADAIIDATKGDPAKLQAAIAAVETAALAAITP